jgi:cholesterol oxidase
MGATVSPSATGLDAPDAIVVGSGFGGAVTACRLAQSGRRVLVLERGPRRSGDQFPRFPRSGVAEWLWTSRWNGFWDFRPFRRMSTLTSSGVGGGSHAYANVHLRAPAASFREGWPQGMGPETLAPYYHTVERQLGVRPFPDAINVPKTEAYRRAATAIGVPSFAPNLAVFFDEEYTHSPRGSEPDYRHDPYNLGVDVMQSPCLHTGECDLGCRFGAKNTVDLNYLAIAEQLHGAHVQPLSEVLTLVPERGGYRVHYRDRQTFRQHSVWAPQVVVAAGTINSNELLLRCRDEFKSLPKLSAALGTHFSGNGDFLCGALNTREALDPWNGPVITTALPYEADGFHFYLQEGGFSPDLAFLVAAMHPNSSFATQMMRGPISHLARLRTFHAEIGRLAMEHSGRERSQVPANSMIFLGMGQDASDGRITLKRRFGQRPKLAVEWDHTASRPMLNLMENEFKRISAQLGGIYAASPLWALLKTLITVHPLGGCAIADDESLGVCSPFGEVWNYPGLFVADGSSIPRSLGPNPSLTISAVAERIAEHIVAA